MAKQLEIACFCYQSAIHAIQAGASRIELCSDYSLGGITPDVETFSRIRTLSDVPVYVMIRPRGGNFVYTKSELHQMIEEIQEFHLAGADGFVFGCLDSDSKLDFKSNEFLLKFCEGKPVTFHRAFDEIPDSEQSIDVLPSMGFSSLLTAGGASNAWEGRMRLKEYVEMDIHGLEIIVGGGVRSSNVQELDKFIHANWYHSAAIVDESQIAAESEIRKLRKGLS
jgi:copper homeostasis protein